MHFTWNGATISESNCLHFNRCRCAVHMSKCARALKFQRTHSVLVHITEKSHMLWNATQSLQKLLRERVHSTQSFNWKIKNKLKQMKRCMKYFDSCDSVQVLAVWHSLITPYGMPIAVNSLLCISLHWIELYLCESKCAALEICLFAVKH